MGALWSTTREYSEVSSVETCKRQKLSSSVSDENSRLIPNIPDELSIQIFARIPRVHYFRMKLVARNWKAVLTSLELYHLRKEIGMNEEWLYLLIQQEKSKFSWYAVDPLSKVWQRLPPLIPNIDCAEESKSGFSGLRVFNMVGTSYIFPEFIRGLFGRKQLPDQLPFRGCRIGTVNGCLYVLGGLSKACAMSCVWRYDPILNTWNEVASMLIGRAHFETNVLNNKIYVIGGIGGVQGRLLPLQSGEVFDPVSNTWSKIPDMPFSKAQSLPAFTVEMLNPIATGMTTYKGRLYVPQSLYFWPVFFDVGGVVYDPKTNSWDEMPIGMGEGWPTRQGGSKLSIVVDGELYALGPSSCLNGGKMKVYDEREDAWKVVIEEVPTSASGSHYLLANLYGRIQVIAKDSDHNIVISQADVCSDAHSPSSIQVRSLDPDPDTVVWKVIASMDLLGPAELVSCKVLDI